MNKNILKFILLFLFVPSFALAAPTWNRSIHAEWQYEAPEDVKVSSFRLYQNGIQACEFVGELTRSGDCEVSLTRKTTNYSLTAVEEDGSESPHSDIYPFIDWGPKAKINQIINR